MASETYTLDELAKRHGKIINDTAHGPVYHWTHSAAAVHFEWTKTENLTSQPVKMTDAEYLEALEEMSNPTAKAASSEG